MKTILKTYSITLLASACLILMAGISRGEPVAADIRRLIARLSFLCSRMVFTSERVGMIDAANVNCPPRKAAAAKAKEAGAATKEAARNAAHSAATKVGEVADKAKAATK